MSVNHVHVILFEFLDMGTDEKGLVNFRAYVVLALTAVVSAIILIGSVLGGQWGTAALSTIVLVVAVSLIFIAVQKDGERRGRNIERQRKHLPPYDAGTGS